MTSMRRHRLSMRNVVTAIKECPTSIRTLASAPWPGARWGTSLFGRCYLDHGVTSAPGHSPQSPGYAALEELLSCGAPVEWLVDLARQPQVVQEDRQPAGDTD